MRLLKFYDDIIIFPDSVLHVYGQNISAVIRTAELYVN